MNIGKAILFVSVGSMLVLVLLRFWIVPFPEYFDNPGGVTAGVSWLLNNEPSRAMTAVLIFWLWISIAFVVLRESVNSSTETETH